MIQFNLILIIENHNSTQEVKVDDWIRWMTAETALLMTAIVGYII